MILRVCLTRFGEMVNLMEGKVFLGHNGIYYVLQRQLEDFDFGN